MKDESEHSVRSWIDQLIAHGMIVRDGEHSVLKITDNGWQLLRGERSLTLTQPRSHTVESTSADQWDGVDRELFDHLRQIRMDLAVERGVPPYVIFGDVTLRELAKFRPTSREGMMTIYGVGEQKMGQFGKTFLATISLWCEQHQLDTNLSRDGSSRQASRPRPSRDS